MGTSFQTIVREINAKRVGCTCVTGKAGRLEGIIVDGDLRRAMLKDPDIRKWNSSNLRTPKPTTILVGATLAQALQAMEQRSIFQLIVVDGKKRPVGLVHLHDLLGRGTVRIG
jgi:arabinose-5-phosphate isomerase